LLTIEEITQLIDDDISSDKKKQARKGQAYYEGKHDILKCRLFYYNADGILVEDKYRANIKISHPFFTELVDQSVQYSLSGGSFIKTDDPQLQKALDQYFDDEFYAELADTATDAKAKGFAYMYSFKNEKDMMTFQNADSLGVVEVEERFASDKQAHVLYWYIDRVDKERKKVKKIMDWTADEVAFYVQYDNGNLTPDATEPINPSPHIVITENEEKYAESFGYIPFFRLDNNKRQASGLAPIKDLIDDYDLMASSLSNNLADFDTPIHVVKGFQGDNLDELQTNMKTKKMIGVDDDGGVEIQTVDVPYEARKVKLDIDEKNIYRFGMGLNISGLKDTAATTNIAIKAAYSLLDLQALKFEIKLKQFMSKLVGAVLKEINSKQSTDYQLSQVYYKFEHEVMSNETENAQNALTESQKRQTEINTLLGLATYLDNETLIQLVCEQLDIEYEEIKSKLPDPDDAVNQITDGKEGLDGIEPDGGDVGE